MEIDVQKLRQSLQSNAYVDLVAFLSSELENLKNIDNVKEYSKSVDQAIELKAQKKAYEKLRSILGKIMRFQDSKPKPDLKNNDYGITIREGTA